MSIFFQKIYKDHNVKFIEMTDFKNTLPQKYEQENEDGTVKSIEIGWPALTRGFKISYIFFITFVLRLDFNKNTHRNQSNRKKTK